MVFALAGDSTINKFFAISKYVLTNESASLFLSLIAILKETIKTQKIMQVEENDFY
jgi:hypothetical protein